MMAALQKPMMECSLSDCLIGALVCPILWVLPFMNPEVPGDICLVIYLLESFDPGIGHSIELAVI